MKSATRRCRWCRRFTRTETDESQDQVAHRVRGVYCGAGGAGSVERLAAPRHGESLAAHHLGKLRLGGRCAGDEGESRTTGFRGALCTARRARKSTRATTRASHALRSEFAKGGEQHHGARREGSDRGYTKRSRHLL